MTFTYLIKRFNRMKHLKKFNEKKNSNAFLSGKEVLQDISDILISLKDEGIEYTISPDINDDIKVKMIGLFFSGTSDVPRTFEIRIRTLQKGKDTNHFIINDEQQEELESVIQRLVNYFESIDIKLKFELSFNKNIPGARDSRNILRPTNILKSEKFNKSMLVKEKGVICRILSIKLKRENNI